MGSKKDSRKNSTQTQVTETVTVVEKKKALEKVARRKMPALTRKEENVVRMVHGVSVEPDAELEYSSKGREIKALEARLLEKIYDIEQKRKSDVREKRRRSSVKKKIIASLKEINEK